MGFRRRGEDQKLSSGLEVEEIRRRDSDLVFQQSSACLRDSGVCVLGRRWRLH